MNKVKRHIEGFDRELIEGPRKQESDVQNFSGFGDICNNCENQKETEISDGVIATRCKLAGTWKNFKGDLYGEKRVVMTDLVRFTDGSEYCSGYA